MRNVQHRNNFRFEVPDNGASETFLWQVQSTSIPGVNLEIAPVSKGPNYRKLANNHVSGTGTSFDDLSVTFLMDENLESYAEMYRWLIAMNNPTGPSCPGYGPSSVLLHIMDNNKDKIVVTYRFVDAFPKTLGDVEWNYTENGDLDAVTCDVTFEYSYFEMICKTPTGDVIVRP